MGKKSNLKTYLVMAVILLGMGCAIAAGDVIYVDDDANVGGDGQTWETAYKYLQDALDDALTDDQIWVAEGTYKPDDDDANHPDGTGDREATFQLINGVGIYGGFAGSEDPCTFDLGELDFVTNETILSGDLDGNDVDVNDPCDLQTEPTRGENSYHVVTGSYTDANTVLDGFTITGGNATDDDGGRAKGDGATETGTGQDSERSPGRRDR